jgi:hypothetical protein
MPTCVASGGSAGDDWTGTLSTSGATTVTETGVGTVTYSITCAGVPPAVTPSTSVIIKTAAAPPAATSTTHGGGGAVDDLFLLIIGVPFLVSLGRARRSRRSRHSIQMNPRLAGLKAERLGRIAASAVESAPNQLASVAAN